MLFDLTNTGISFDSLSGPQLMAHPFITQAFFPCYQSLLIDTQQEEILFGTHRGDYAKNCRNRQIIIPSNSRRGGALVKSRIYLIKIKRRTITYSCNNQRELKTLLVVSFDAWLCFSCDTYVTLIAPGIIMFFLFYFFCFNSVF
jgi:hypothetical protein